MQIRCAVPNCQFSRKEVKNKRSFFRVPRDLEMWKKWEEAIPGVVTLKINQVVCEKHFPESDICRAWIRRDSTGKLLAQSAYKIPHLVKTAVPSIFSYADEKEIEASAQSNFKAVGEFSSPLLENVVMIDTENSPVPGKGIDDLAQSNFKADGEFSSPLIENVMIDTENSPISLVDSYGADNSNLRMAAEENSEKKDPLDIPLPAPDCVISEVRWRYRVAFL